MARTKSTSKTKNSTAAKKSDSRAKKAASQQMEPPLEPPKPIRKEVSGVVFLCLAAFMIISYFNTDGAFIAFFAKLIKGLIGWGFWIAAPVFLLIGFILIFHHGKPVEFRVFSALLLPILFSAVAELVISKPDFTDADFTVLVNGLFESGTRMESGGVLGSLIAGGLNMALSMVITP